MNLRSWSQAVMSINGAVIVRAARHGISDAMDRARRAFSAIDPFGDASGNENDIPLIDLHEIVPNASDVIVDGRFATVDGSLPPHELIPLMVLAKHFNPKTILEIGTYFGSTTRNLAMNLPDATIHTIDLPPDFSTPDFSTPDFSTPEKEVMAKDDFHLIKGRRLGAAFANTPEAARIVQHLGDSAVYDYSIITPAPTFFFVDGSHTRDYARHDTLQCMKLAVAPSVLLWHDVNYLHAGVVQWMTEMIAAGLDVRRIFQTSIAYLPFSPNDPAVVRLLRQ